MLEAGNPCEELEDILWSHIEKEVAKDVMQWQVNVADETRPRQLLVTYSTLGKLLVKAVEQQEAQTKYYMHFMSIKSILQVLTFLRGDSKYKFAIDSEASDSYSVHLRVLKARVTILPTIITGLQLLPCVIVSGAHRTFLKEGSTLPYFPSGRTDRGKDAPHSVYVRALHIKKSLLDDKDRQFLDQGT